MIEKKLKFLRNKIAVVLSYVKKFMYIVLER